MHDGDTVMDYMEQERDRGITITAAAITLPWNKHQVQQGGLIAHHIGNEGEGKLFCAFHVYSSVQLRL